jgi:hypothetical protein
VWARRPPSARWAARQDLGHRCLMAAGHVPGRGG